MDVRPRVRRRRLAAGDRQRSRTLLLGTGNTALLLWVLSKQRGNDKDTKTAKDASLATAATNGVPANVLPEVGPMQKAINGGALASRVAALETQVARIPEMVREAIREVRDEIKPEGRP
jgi:hypothetical protein